MHQFPPADAYSIGSVAMPLDIAEPNESGFEVAPVVLGFDAGARRLGQMTLPLWRRSISLHEAMIATPLALPPLPEGVEGYKLRAVTVAQAESLLGGQPLLPWVRQRYDRSFADLTIGFDAWLAGLSSSTRQGLRRKSKRLAEASGGCLDVRMYRRAEEMAEFFAIARQLSAVSYQERLLSAGLSADALAEMLSLAAKDAVRGFLLFINGRPAAYLYVPARGDVLIYSCLGYHPDFADLSPGSVLQYEAFRLLLAEQRFAWFDFTEGGGQHKQSFATGSLASVDLLLLRPTMANRLRLGALGSFDSVVAFARSMLGQAGVRQMRKLLRG